MIFRDRIAPAVVPVFVAAAVRALGATLRLRAAGLEALVPLWSARRPIIYAVWHERILMVPWVNARLRRTQGARTVRVLTSRSRDGELAARFARRFGLSVARGSSSRGGAIALRALASALAAGDDVAVVPDGPRGPRCSVQPGVIMLAATSGAPIVPVGFSARPARRLATWDEFMIPLPFARCAVVFGEAAAVARTADREEARRAVQDALNSVTATADHLVDA